ncbi:MAG: ABC transporter substrate-binding protein [Mycoplasmatota bacterium]
MKKYLTIFCLITLGIMTFLAFLPEKEESDLTKINVAEVAHSIFYAPQYAADALGYFEEEGLDVEFILTSGADAVSAAVLSGDIEIGFAGSESTIYIYNGGEEDYLVSFAGLTKRDGSFIVSREYIEDFTLDDLIDSHVIAGRVGGMPVMTFEYTLSEYGIDSTNDLYVDTSIDFASMAGAFISGTGDFVNLFEPQATLVESQGFGYVVASLGELGGVVPYTSYNAKKSYIEDNPEVIEGFSNAIQKGIDFVLENNSEDIADIIIDYFPDTSLSDLVSIIDRYKEADSWFDTTYITEEDFNLVQDIMINSGELEEYVDYSKLVTTEFAN